MKSVLISIQPYWVFLIIAKAMGWKINNEKTIEVRKNLPKAENWDKTVKIYCSKDKRSFVKIPNEYQPIMEQFLGKVIGEFVCDKIERIEVRHFSVLGHENRYTAVGDNPDHQWLKKSCLSYDEIAHYGNNAPLYGWHIPDFVIYDKPKPLWDFMKCGAPTENELDDELCSYCEQTDWGERQCYGTPDGPVMCEGAFCSEAYDLYLDANFVLKRPPESWCYVEEAQ